MAISASAVTRMALNGGMWVPLHTSWEGKKGVLIVMSHAEEGDATVVALTVSGEVLRGKKKKWLAQMY